MKARAFVRLLKESGHDVATTADLGIDGAGDRRVLEAAYAEQRALITYNCDDFRALHEQVPSHGGLLLLYQEPNKRMSFADMIRALTNIESAGLQLEGQIYALNAWSF